MRALLRKNRGFTLIEVLIVVVIIGVLAALVIPRFVSAPEKAIVAEADQMLGSLIRAQQAIVDGGGGAVGAGTLSAANWTSLGMSSPTSSKFTYACTSPTCTASRTIGTGVGTAQFNFTNNAWSCGAGYTLLTNGGCTLA